jgi:hypothetical protein
MTKKHFIALADMIKKANEDLNSAESFNTSQIDLLANFCSSQNPNFNEERWIDYINGECGKNGGKVKVSK